MPSAKLTFEVEIEISADIIAPDRMTGGIWDDVENITVDGVSQLVMDYDRSREKHKIRWLNKDLLDGVDVKAPAIQRLFENILAINADAARDALICPSKEEAA
jgi:hypothetical protein